ncbi:prepilin-type N-terminal cleavage/methylation domain-containing protein [Ruficoccus sp. ZRK36]|nr:prepilin-type N-terminal cleavage/methylation domain-containing protein [Ruficoccus sp. ZRK36]
MPFSVQPRTKSAGTRRKRPGFTLVEIMVVVIIVGLLAAIAVPNIRNARIRSQNSFIMNGFRQFKSAFTIYNMEHGTWPSDVNEGILPDEMEGYLKSYDFEAELPVGGQWDWEQGVFDIIAGISLRDANVSDEQMTIIDQALDDGDIESGNFRVVDDGAYTLILEE